MGRDSKELELTGEFGEQAYWHVPEGVNTLDYQVHLEILSDTAIQGMGCVDAISKPIPVNEWKIPPNDESSGQ